MKLAVQYYRAPFPRRKYWGADLEKIRATGFDAIQLFVLWPWIESVPGVFRYDEYDELTELAAKSDLQVVVSTIAEVHPNWLPRLIPNSEMIDVWGNKVLSTTRSETHFGLSPGGCIDHPEVWTRMSVFLKNTVQHFAAMPNILGYDVWNELRWNEHADELVCYCPHTLALFRKYLCEKFGSLDGLNQAWERRYVDWQDVYPGKLPNRGLTEQIEFQRFLTWRADRHAADRCRIAKAADPARPVTLHGGAPSGLEAGTDEARMPLDRGNDWNFAETFDGVGCSSYPEWFGIDDADFAGRMELVASATRLAGKKLWLSELQGGRASVGFSTCGGLRAAHQQRWVWNGLANGAELIIFWCWRDEVFGRESAGYGLAGADGFAEERMAAMRKSSDLLRRHGQVLADYCPAAPKIGIWVSPYSYYFSWAQEGSAARIRDSLLGYARMLGSRSIPVTYVEEEHPAALEGLKMLILPHTLVLTGEQETLLSNFVKNGGTLVCESECGAFERNGFYRYPEERFTARLGVVEQGRRMLSENESDFTVEYGSTRYCLGHFQWSSPFVDAGDSPLFQVKPFGRGRMVAFGGYPGNAAHLREYPDFPKLLERLAEEAGALPACRVVAPKPGLRNPVYVKSGSTGTKKIYFIFFPAGTESVTLQPDEGGSVFREITGDREIPRNPDGSLTVVPGLPGIAICVG